MSTKTAFIIEYAHATPDGEYENVTVERKGSTPNDLLSFEPSLDSCELTDILELADWIRSETTDAN